MKKMPEEIVKDLEVLFDYDDFEEICYPIIRYYFLDAIGKPETGEYEVRCVEKAYSILAEKSDK